VYDTSRGFALSLREFDRIVETLCLSSDDRVAQSKDWIPPLFTVIRWIHSKDAGWKRSTWIPSASKVESFVTLWEKKYRSFRFQWP
jgi:hypothetical protein